MGGAGWVWCVQQELLLSPGPVSLPTAQLMKNTGVILANDSNTERLKSVVGNLHRLGVTNTIISHYDGRQFPKVGLVFPVASSGSLAPDDMAEFQCCPFFSFRWWEALTECYWTLPVVAQESSPRTLL